MPQQKLDISHEGLMFADITLFDEDGKGHLAKALISTASEGCVIDSAFYRLQRCLSHHCASH